MKSLKSKSAISMILVAAIIVIIIVAGAVGGYILMTQPSSNPSPSPSPSASPSATATPEVSPSVTTTPTSTSTPSPTTQSIANFKAGAYAIYNTTSVSNGVTAVTTTNLTITEGTYEGTPCWTLITTAGTATDKAVITFNIDKGNTSKFLGNVTMKMWVGGELFMDEQFDAANASSAGSGTQIIDPSAITGYETVTVAAGTFQNCAKATTTTTTTTGQTEVTNLWLSPNVPIFGIVKAEGTISGAPSSTLELVSYGGYP